MLAILIIGVFLVTGFCIAFYACCVCPSGQLDGAFYSIPPEDPYRMERQITKLERDKQ